MTNRKQEIIRVVIFTVIAVIPMIILGLAMNSPRCREGVNDPAYSSLITLSMFAPSLANILTRTLTKEGFGEMYLRPNFRKSTDCYILSIVLPVVCSVCVVPVMLGVFGDKCSTEGFKPNLGFFGTVIISIVGGITLFWLGLAEEFGWRAYLTPKLEKLLPLPAALTLSGIIWGMWHAPIIVHGLNFGLDYPGYPYAGFALMCVFCIFTGCTLTFLTKKSGSVLPAAVCHGVIDTVIIPQLVITRAEIEEQTFLLGICSMLPGCIMGLVFLVILLKGLRTKEKA